MGVVSASISRSAGPIMLKGLKFTGEMQSWSPSCPQSLICPAVYPGVPGDLTWTLQQPDMLLSACWVMSAAAVEWKWDNKLPVLVGN